MIGKAVELLQKDLFSISCCACMILLNAVNYVVVFPNSKYTFILSLNLIWSYSVILLRHFRFHLLIFYSELKKIIHKWYLFICFLGIVPSLLHFVIKDVLTLENKLGKFPSFYMPWGNVHNTKINLKEILDRIQLQS